MSIHNSLRDIFTSIPLRDKQIQRSNTKKVKDSLHPAISLLRLVSVLPTPSRACLKTLIKPRMIAVVVKVEYLIDLLSGS